MPYKSNALSVLAFAKDFTLWHYRSGDTAIDEGYFDGAEDLLAGGDMILANLGQGTESRVGIYLVTANAAGAVSFDDLSGGTPGLTRAHEPLIPAEDSRQSLGDAL